MKEEIQSKVQGHVLIRDKVTGEVLVDRKNAINYETFSEALALSLADRTNGHIHEMVFGNGGTTVSGTGAITYFPPNTTGADAQLYNQTYSKIVDDQSPLNLDPTRNSLAVRHTLTQTYTDIIITCTLDYNEPANGQEVFDTATDPAGNFIFDELGLKTFNAIPGSGKLITHVVFHPVQKSINRVVEIIYSLRIAMSS